MKETTFYYKLLLNIRYAVAVISALFVVWGMYVLIFFKDVPIWMAYVFAILGVFFTIINFIIKVRKIQKFKQEQAIKRIFRILKNREQEED